MKYRRNDRQNRKEAKPRMPPRRTTSAPSASGNYRRHLRVRCRQNWRRGYYGKVWKRQRDERNFHRRVKRALAGLIAPGWHHRQRGIAVQASASGNVHPIGEDCFARLQTQLLVGPEYFLAVAVRYITHQIGGQSHLAQVLKIEGGVMIAHGRVAHCTPGFLNRSGTARDDRVGIDLPFLFGDN